MNEYEIFEGEEEDLKHESVFADSPEEAIDAYTDEHPVALGTKVWAQNVDDPEDYLIVNVGIS